MVERAVSSKAVPISEKLSIIYAEVNRILGQYKENTMVIRDAKELSDYIDVGISNGAIAVDTETNNSLDPISCKLMGLCLYTPNQKNAYVPINHINMNSGERLSNQLSEHDVAIALSKLNNVDIIMHNGNFDYRVLKCTCGVECIPTWDTLIGAKILDENEKRAGLKEQFIDKIDKSQEKYDIEHLFSGVKYEIVDPNIFSLYAATDSYMTYKLYEWQKKQFGSPNNKGIYRVFKEIEMPIVQVSAEMELTGVEIDKEYASRLSIKYHKLVSETDIKIQNEIEKYRDIIDKWRMSPEANNHPIGDSGKVQKSKSEQLKDPIQVTSNTQLAILLYDVLKIPIVDKKNPRGVGEEILEKIDNPLCELVLEKRGLEKLLSTYIDALPNVVSAVDNRLHAGFNQLGAKTGRFSSSEPNLQNIPSHNREIRMMFKASDGNVFVGADYSQQEPRLLSAYSGDEAMIGAYKNGKDLYAMIASRVYKNNYEDNLEKHKDGTAFPEGKKRRSSVKSLLLGILYGMGAPNLATELNMSVSEAQKFIDDFYSGFPKVKKWMDNTESSAMKLGYVEDLWGRRRRLPDMQLKKYEVVPKNMTSTFNPILYTSGVFNPINDSKVADYISKLNSAKYKKDIDAIKASAEKGGFLIRDNSAKISRAQRQCVNARVQGGAASMTKIAMRKIFDSDELKRLGFKLVMQVHDEVIGECPKENAEEAGVILTSIMKSAVEGVVEVPFKCDVDISPCWYYNDYGASIISEYESIKETSDEKTAFSSLCKNHIECTEEQIKEFLRSKQ